MGWRDELRPGKFRNAAFFTAAMEGTIGRRVVTHEYPGREQPYSEDLGKLARTYSFECFVIGPDYIGQRNLLINALEAVGPGTLVHPLWGSLRVNITSCRVAESNQKGGMAAFTVDFVEAGTNDQPSDILDSGSFLEQQINAALGTVLGDFSAAFGVDSLSSAVGLDSLDAVNQALDAVQIAGATVATVKNFKSNASNALGDPLGLATGISGLIGEVGDVPGLRKLHNFGASVTILKENTPTRIAQAVNRRSISNLVEGVSVLETARVLVSQ